MVTREALQVGILTLVAAVSGTARASTCEDLSWLTPPGFDAPATPREQVIRDTTLYMLRGLVPWDDQRLVLEEGRITLACDAVPEFLHAQLRATRDEQAKLNYSALRTLYRQVYRETRELRDHASSVPLTVNELKAVTNYRTWPVTVVSYSSIKRKTRVIYRSPNDQWPRLSVSETLATTTGDRNAPVLETEVATVRLDGSGDWDFYSYDEQGHLATEGQFPAGLRPSPTVCVNCHYDSSKRQISRLMPQDQ